MSIRSYVLAFPLLHPPTRGNNKQGCKRIIGWPKTHAWGYFHSHTWRWCCFSIISFGCYATLIWYIEHILTNQWAKLLIVRMDKTKMMAIKSIQARHYPTFTHNRELIQCKASNILVLMSHGQISGMDAMSLDFKQVGIVIICLRINATEVILEDEK